MKAYPQPPDQERRSSISAKAKDKTVVTLERLAKALYGGQTDGQLIHAYE